jgi:hypothetical protein
MSEVILDELYWTELKRCLEPLSQHTTIERFLFNTADFEELANVIFDDLDVLRHLQSLPDSLTEVRSFGDAYFERLDYLIGDGPQITRNAPIYDPNERARLLTETTMFIAMLDQMLGENSEA